MEKTSGTNAPGWHVSLHQVLFYFKTWFSSKYYKAKKHKLKKRDSGDYLISRVNWIFAEKIPRKVDSTAEGHNHRKLKKKRERESKKRGMLTKNLPKIDFSEES